MKFEETPGETKIQGFSSDTASYVRGLEERVKELEAENVGVVKIKVECVNGHEIRPAMWIDSSWDLRLTILSKCHECECLKKRRERHERRTDKIL